MFGSEAEQGDDATGNPWPAFADLLAATTLLFLVLFAAVALPAIIENEQTEAVRTRLRDLELNLRPDSTDRVTVVGEGDYLRIVIDGDATFPQGASELENLREDGRQILLRFAQKVRQKNLLPDIAQIQVVGHTSSEGSDALNWRLSSARAASVALLLITTGELPACKVTALGRGRFYPVSPESARRSDRPAPQDRRIELEIRPLVLGDAEQQRQQSRCVETVGNLTRLK